MLRFVMAEHDWEEVAARTWDILAQHALKKRQLYYSDLGAQLGLHHRLVRFPLELLQAYCLGEGKPPLTILVIDKATHLPGSGFTAAPLEAREEKLREVLQWPWQEEPNPYGFARDGTTSEELVNRILSGPDEASTVLEKVPGRGPLQSIFREALLKAYKGRCAFSGSSLEHALEAAHIVPWAQATDIERIDVQNGLLLNAYFHRLFDRHVLCLDEHYRVRLDPNIVLKDLNTFDRHAIEPVVDAQIKYPRNQRFFPNRNLIRRRYAHDEG